MTQEEKQLLLQDLCARLPYGVKYKDAHGNKQILNVWSKGFHTALNTILYDDRPSLYLRPMSSMTEEERLDLSKLTNDRFKFYLYTNMPQILCCEGNQYNYLDGLSIIDWLNEHHFDYHGLIEKGLALKAPEGMYNFKNN